MALEKYKRTGRRTTKEPSVTITQSGFTLNRAAVEKYFKSGHSHVEFLFDSAEKTIGFQPLDKQTIDSFPVRIYRDNSPIGIISAKQFIREKDILNLAGTKGQRMFPISEGKDGLLLVILKK